MRTLFLSAIAVFVATTTVIAQPQPVEPVPDARSGQESKEIPDPASFAKSAAEGINFEIMAAKIALRRSMETVIRSFAEQLLEDNQKAQADLQEAANSHGTTIEPSLSKNQLEQLQALEAAPKDQFGAAFLSLQAVAHQEALKLHFEFAEGAKEGQLKAYARSQLSTLRMHLVHAQSASNP